MRSFQTKPHISEEWLHMYGSIAQIWRDIVPIQCIYGWYRSQVNSGIIYACAFKTRFKVCKY